jgi:hypothetical protein
MTSAMFFGAVLGFGVQFGVIYGAIRLALVHDRTAPDKKVKREAEANARVHP